MCAMVAEMVRTVLVESYEIVLPNSPWPNAISGVPTGSFQTGEQNPVQIDGSIPGTQSVMAMGSGGGGGGFCARAELVTPIVSAATNAATTQASLRDFTFFVMCSILSCQ